MFDIGTDIEDINRFKKYSLEKDKDFLESIFSKEELEYSFSQKKYAQHLAVRFCATNGSSLYDLRWRIRYVYG